jgi:uncharacterized protein (TIGR02001 family)
MNRPFTSVWLVLFVLLLASTGRPLVASEPTVAAEPAPESQGGLSASVGIASEYIVHGLARSLGEPVVNGQLGYGFGRGWLVAARASTMNLNPGPGPSRELGIYLGHRRALSENWELGANLARYEYWKDTAYLPYAYSEATVEATWRSQWRLRVQYSPDYSLVSRQGPAREFDTWTGELQFSLPIRPGLSLAAAAGYYDLTAGLGRGYYFWSLGAMAARGRATLALNYVGVDNTAKSLFATAYTRERLIATLALRIR